MKMIIKKPIPLTILVFTICLLVFCGVRQNMAAVTAALSDRPVTIVIDAGHGGEDGGAIGISGVTESLLNLSISLRMEQFLEFLGYQTYMIRKTDTAVYTEGTTFSEKKVSDLKNRVSIINSIDPAILVSIHQNHFPQNQYSGAQVFYSCSDGSKELAETMQPLLRQVLDPENQRNCRQADSVYLMKQIRCPGVLVECGFLSNSREEALLQQPEYQKKIISAIACALVQHISKGADELEV